MNIKILGSGCPSCHRLEDNAKKAVSNLGITATFEKVTDFNQMMSYGIMATPALVINGKVVSMGKVLTVQELENIVKRHQ